MNSPVQFTEEDVYKSRSILGQPRTPKIVDFLVKKGFVKDESTAGKLLFLLSIVFLLFALGISIFYVSGFNRPDYVKISKDAMNVFPKTEPPQE
ncbi:MAG: hypothetical protein WCO16_00285 [bacterium]